MPRSDGTRGAGGSIGAPGAAPISKGLFAGVARVAIRWRWAVIGGWLVATILAVLLLPTIGDVVHNDSTTFLPASSPSVRAQALATPFIQEGDQSGVLVAVRSEGTLDDRDQRALRAMEARLRTVPGVTGVSTAGVSANGQAASVAVQFSPITAGGGATGSAVVAAVRAVMRADTPGDLQTYLTGSLPILVDQQHAVGHTASYAAILSIVLILVVLSEMIEGARSVGPARPTRRRGHR